MIVGTAGHIDHGKTTLVRALTGVDTDRLPQEKARGISIELGYAFLDVPDSADRLGFIDVPGHERLVHTMIAGATGIDYALLLVAADDGVMPQTREHLAVLSLLGIRRGAVVITKIDRVDAARVAQLRAELPPWLAGTQLSEAPVLAVSAATGAGMAALREVLFDAARAKDIARATANGKAGFRLAIDRAFTLNGIGTVVTGTVHAGIVHVGDELALVPSVRSDLRARVRSLHAQDRAVDMARAGVRCAIGISGITKNEIARGQWLVDPDMAIATDRFDAMLTCSPGEARPLRSGTQVHVHVGAATALGSVTVLAPGDAPDAQTIAPGGTGHVQLTLRAPIGAWHGDRVVLRDAAATRTIAGGRVLDPFAPARYRRTAERLAELAAWALPDPAQRLRALVEAAPHGVALTAWARAEGLIAVPEIADTWTVAPDSLDAWVIGAAQTRAATDRVLATLQSFHERDPEVLGPDAARLRRLAVPRWPDPLWRALLDDLKDQALVETRGSIVYLPAHAAQLSASDERLWEKVAPILANGDHDGIWVRDLARDAGANETLMRQVLGRLARRGELHQVVKDLYYAPVVIARLARIARTLAADAGNGDITAAAFRDATGLGRKRAIQLLEYFDRIGLLRRVGDTHRLRTDSSLFSETTR